MARDILKTLKEEHDTLRGLFAELKETTDRGVKKRQTLLQRIEESLIPHAKWEESVFYPAFKERADRDGQQTYAEALTEHHAVEHTVIPEVHAADPGTPEFAGRTKVFGELIDHHATHHGGEFALKLGSVSGVFLRTRHRRQCQQHHEDKSVKTHNARSLESAGIM